MEEYKGLILDKVEEQLNIRLSAKELEEVMEAIRQFGGGSQSKFGRLALKYFIKQLREKGALAMMSEVMD